MYLAANKEVRKATARGFSLLELAVVIAIILIVALVTGPSMQKTMAAYRGSAAISGIAGQLSLSRMRAASNFTRTRLVIDTSTNTYRREVYNKTTAAYETEGGTQSLGQRVTFGYSTITVPAGTQSTIGQSTAIYFNSRGIPITSSGVPTGEYSIYLHNNDSLFYAVSVNPAGQVSTWRYIRGSATWVTQ